MKYNIRAIYKNGFVQNTSLTYDTREKAEAMAAHIRIESAPILGTVEILEIA